MKNKVNTVKQKNTQKNVFYAIFENCQTLLIQAERLNVTDLQTDAAVRRVNGRPGSGTIIQADI